MSFRLVETGSRAAAPPDLVTRFRWRARLRRRKLERERIARSFRWEVVRRDDGRYEVAAFLNQLEPA